MGRLCDEGAKVFFAPALGAPGGRDRSAGHAKTGAPKPHLSGQPGGCHVNVLPDKPKVKDGSLRERAQPGAQKYPRKDFVSLTR